MLKPFRLQPIVRRSWIAPLVLALAACGGGGGSSTPKAPDALQVVVNKGDTMPGGFVVNNVESARMANDGTVAVIVSDASTPAVNAVFLRHPDGSLERVLDQNTPLAQGLTLTQVGQLLITPTGEVTFKDGGNNIDHETVFSYANGHLTRLASALDPVTPPGFRKLGDMRTTSNGQVAFTYGENGTKGCTIDSSSGTDRIRCKLDLVTGTVDGVSPVALPNNLDSQSPTAIGLDFNAGGDLLVGLPASGGDPLLGLVRGGVFQSVVTRKESFPDFGDLYSATPRAIATNADVVFDGGFDTNGDQVKDDERVLLYSNGGFTSIAKLHDPAGSKFIVDLQGVAIDDAERVTFIARFNDLDQSTGPISLRQWENGTTTEIAFEGEGGFGEDNARPPHSFQILALPSNSIVVNRTGDVVFLTHIGFVENGTQKTAETRIMRWADGQLREVLRTGSTFSGGTISGVDTLADLDDTGDVLLIVEIKGAGRALAIVPRT
jgi:hypothetical protein